MPIGLNERKYEDSLEEKKRGRQDWLGVAVASGHSDSNSSHSVPDAWLHLSRVLFRYRMFHRSKIRQRFDNKLKNSYDDVAGDFDCAGSDVNRDAASASGEALLAEDLFELPLIQPQPAARGANVDLHVPMANSE